MQCREFWEIADSYLSDELSVETNHDVLSHLEHCSECRAELSARRALRAKLRDAFINSSTNQMRPDFANTLSADLRYIALRERHHLRLGQVAWLAIAACLIVVSIVGVVIVRQMLKPNTRTAATVAQNEANSPQQNPQLPLSIVKTELAKSAVGDHRDCAVHFRLSEKPIDLELAGRTYDPVYIGLTKAIVSEQGVVPLGAQFVEAHSCVFEGRRFAHIVLKYHDSLVSFLVTDIPQTREVSEGSPNAIVCSHLDGYKVSCFQTARHAIFVISDLPEGENLALTRALAPSVFEHIRRNERTT